MSIKDEQDLLKQSMEGKTISCVETVRNRLYGYYICITFEDKSKLMIEGNVPYHPYLSAAEMLHAPRFFGKAEWAARLKEEEEWHEKAKADREKAERRTYERLRKKYGYHR